MRHSRNLSLLLENIGELSLAFPTNPPPEVKSRWWAPLQPLVDAPAYLLIRGLTMAAALFCVERLTSALEAPAWLPIPDFFKEISFVLLLAVTLGFAVVSKLVDIIRYRARHWREWAGWLIQGVRYIVMAGLAVTATIGSLYVPPLGKPVTEIKDLFGFLIVLAGVIIVWRLHTRVHRGLIQMWRYTQGGERWSDSFTSFFSKRL